jgi:hypothetical protein
MTFKEIRDGQGKRTPLAKSDRETDWREGSGVFVSFSGTPFAGHWSLMFQTMAGFRFARLAPRSSCKKAIAEEYRTAMV